MARPSLRRAKLDEDEGIHGGCHHYPGIGANTAIFTIVNAVLLRPLPYPESEKLMIVGRYFPETSVISIEDTKIFYGNFKTIILQLAAASMSVFNSSEQSSTRLCHQSVSLSLREA